MWDVVRRPGDIMHGRHSRRELEAEVGFLNDLLDQDIPVAAPIANNAAAYLNEIDAPEGTRYAVLFDAIAGDEPQETNLNHSRSFGQLAGRLHNCADRLARKYDRWHLDDRYLIEEPLNHIRPYLQHRESDFEYLSALGGELMAKLHGLISRQSPEYGLCHGDLHTGNARFDENGRLTLFDFDSCGYGWRAIDIGVYHVSYDWLDLSEKTRREKARFWEAFVEGYNTERPLSSNELAVAQLCLPIRHLELMGLTMRYWSPQIGSSWINDPERRQIGGAMQTHNFAACNGVIWVQPGVGVIASQAESDPFYAFAGFDMIRLGKTPAQILDSLTRCDPDARHNQVAIIDAQGNVAAYTGENCIEEAGHHEELLYGPNLPDDQTMALSLAQFQEAIGRIPNEDSRLQYQCSYALTLLQKGNRAEALSIFRSVFAANPTYREAVKRVARAEPDKFSPQLIEMVLSLRVNYVP